LHFSNTLSGTAPLRAERGEPHFTAEEESHDAEKQAQANKSNARKSTGPTSTAGKENSKMNAVKHGLLSQYAVMGGEDEGKFEALRTMLFEEFKPFAGFEETLVEDLASHYWRLARLLRMENNILALAKWEIRHRIASSKASQAEIQAIGLDDPLRTSEHSPACKDLKDKAEAVKAKVEQVELSFGGAFLHNVENGDALSKLARHEVRIRNEIRKIVAELEERLEKRPKPKTVSPGAGGHSLNGTPDDSQDSNKEAEIPM
jgi:hypothetical protein